MNIVITGATGAIGSALATLLNARGETLLLCGRSDEKLETLNRALGGAHHTVAADLTDAAGCAVLQAKAVQLGVIGGLAHCVGSTVVRPLHLTSEKDWQEQFAVNATSAFHVLKWFVLQATKAQAPAIAVLTSSVVAEAHTHFLTCCRRTPHISPGRSSVSMVGREYCGRCPERSRLD